MDKRLKGYTALVTGAAWGFGKGIALELARAGCRVAVNYHSNANAAEETVAEIEQLGVEAFAVQADVASSECVKEMFDSVLSRFDQLNILVNNAGIQTWKSLLELNESDWLFFLLAKRPPSLADRLSGWIAVTQAPWPSEQR